MMPIPPVPAVDEALKAATPGAAGGTPSIAAPPELRQQFEALMQRHDAAQASDGASRGPNAVGSLIDSQQAQLNDLDASMSDLIEKMPGMNPTDLTTASMTMMHKVSEMHVRMSLSMGVTKSSNKSLQSLLKNE
jgi:Bacterial type III secretion protein (HrpB2)